MVVLCLMPSHLNRASQNALKTVKDCVCHEEKVTPTQTLRKNLRSPHRTWCVFFDRHLKKVRERGTCNNTANPVTPIFYDYKTKLFMLHKIFEIPFTTRPALRIISLSCECRGGSFSTCICSNSTYSCDNCMWLNVTKNIY